MKKILALVALFFAFASTSAIAKNDYSCDKKFIFFPGGPEGGPFGTIVYNGAVAAAEHTGCDVDYYWSQWNSEIMIKQFKEAVALQPDGIAIYGFPGDEAMRPIINEAREMGIIITTMNTALPSIEADRKTEGFGFVGADNYGAGYSLGAKAVEVCGLKSGDSAFIWGLAAMPNRGERTLGAIQAVEDLGVKVVYQEIPDNVNSDASQGTPMYVATYSANPDIKMVITDHGGLTASLPTYMKAAGHGSEEFVELVSICLPRS